MDEPAAAPPLEPGVYEHRKGRPLRGAPRGAVLLVTRHSETEEEFVVYRQLYGDRGAWVRPLPMFLETVEVEGRAVPRFRRTNGSRPD